MYKCLFGYLHVRVPFDDFTMGVLLILNVAPSQLHPNGWTAFQALQALCLYTYVKATPARFFIILLSVTQEGVVGVSNLDYVSPLSHVYFFI